MKVNSLFASTVGFFLLTLFLYLAMPAVAAPSTTEPAAYHLAATGDAKADLTRDLTILIVGILVGGLVGVLIRVIVDYVLLMFRRHAVKKALLVEIRACSVSAKDLADWLDEHLDVSQKQYLHTIDKPLWVAALKDLRQLPPRHLARLVSFYSFADSINRKVFAYNQEQERLERIGKEASITKALRQIAHTTARMCDELAKFESVKRLHDLPTSYKSEYPMLDSP